MMVLFSFGFNYDQVSFKIAQVGWQTWIFEGFCLFILIKQQLKHLGYCKPIVQLEGVELGISVFDLAIFKVTPWTTELNSSQDFL